MLKIVHFLKMWHFFISYPILLIFFAIFVFFSNCLIQIFSGRFDTSGSMIPCLVPEISPCGAFCEEQRELGIIGVRCAIRGPLT